MVMVANQEGLNMTRKFVVIKDFTDLEDNKHVYKAGHFYPREGAELDDARAADLEFGHNARNEKLIVEVMVKSEPKQEDSNNEEYPKHIGGGYFELSNGKKVQGKEKAVEAEKELNK